MIMDIFSKFGWIVPLKNKKGEIVAKAFNHIFKQNRVPKYLWTDKGREFYNKNLKEILDKRNVKLYSTENKEKIQQLNVGIEQLKLKCGSNLQSKIQLNT